MTYLKDFKKDNITMILKFILESNEIEKQSSKLHLH